MAVPHPRRHHRPMERLRGFSLLELLLVLALLGVLLGIALPSTATWRDRMAVHAAREEVAAALSWTRLAAASSGGAELVVDAATGRVWTVTHEASAVRPVDLRERYGVRVDVGRADTVFLRFDALGIGRIASRRIRILRGRAEAGLVVSAYGRVRRW